MRPRSPPDRGECLRVRPFALLLVVLTSALALAGCGGSTTTITVTQTETIGSTDTGSTTTAPATTGTTTAGTSTGVGTTSIQLFFLRDDKVGATRREIPATAGVGSAALKALTDGPTAYERGAGLSSEVPARRAVPAPADAGDGGRDRPTRGRRGLGADRLHADPVPDRPDGPDQRRQRGQSLRLGAADARDPRARPRARADRREPGPDQRHGEHLRGDASARAARRERPRARAGASRPRPRAAARAARSTRRSPYRMATRATPRSSRTRTAPRTATGSTSSGSRSCSPGRPARVAVAHVALREPVQRHQADPAEHVPGGGEPEVPDDEQRAGCARRSGARR